MAFAFKINFGNNWKRRKKDGRKGDVSCDNNELFPYCTLEIMSDFHPARLK